MDVPDARYARSGGVAIAYQVVGEGPPDIVFSPHLADIYSLWLVEHHRAFLHRLAEEARLVVFNPRGTGLSDRPRNVTLESRMDDFSAVLDAVGSDRATISGMGQSANACALFAATYPDRCDRLVVANLSPRGLRSESYPRLMPSSRPGVSGYVSERIRDSRVVELPAGGLYTPEGAEVILEFVRGKARPSVPDSVLATVLFTDLVGSTERAAELGDRAWRELLAEHHRLVRQELVRFRGVEIDTAGDGFFCRFDGPARAIACARAVVEGSQPLELSVKAGVHTGECEVIDEKIAGIAVNVGSRVASLARPGEVLVSNTVKDLVAGSGIEFEERGEHELKGVPDAWRLYAVVSA
jgi:class 3 adenylate cyclase